MPCEYFRSMKLALQYIHRISEVDRSAWNRIASQNRTPFYEWEWLALLEESGSISAPNGWLPFHLLIRDGERLIAALPLYLKGHSHGEFVFDYGWADVARQLSIDYYPKLVGTAPATPSGHYSLLSDGTLGQSELLKAILPELRNLGAEQGLGSLSFLFSRPEFGRDLEGFAPWINQSYLWVNREYTDFEEYLSDFTKNQRRNVRREWASLEEQGLEVVTLTGKELTLPVMERMYRLYLETNGKFGPWAARFLNRSFFTRLPEFVADRTLIFAALRPGSPPAEAVGMSMCVYKGEWLFGRYWGGDPGYKDLHFNLCYYAPIRWMIEHGVRYFDPGAGSPHKLRRGFLPHGVVSYHCFFNPDLQALFSRTMDGINHETAAMIESMAAEVPYKYEAKLAILKKIDRLFSRASRDVPRKEQL